MKNVFLGFFAICVPLRILIATMCYVTTVIDIDILPYWSIYSFLIIVFFSIRFFQYILSKKQQIGGFGQVVWWNPMRLMHIFIMMAFSVMAIMKQKFAWTILALDIAIGIVAFTVHHSYE
jgi:hypothetical protein